MNRPVRALSLLSFSAILAACAVSTQGGSKSTSSGSDRITRADMEKVRYSSLYDVVQSLRARWLQSRGPSSLMGRPTEVQVIVDDMRMGGVEALRSVRTDNVVSIEFVDPITSGQRWGGKHVQGTILVITHADGVPQRSPAP